MTSYQIISYHIISYIILYHVILYHIVVENVTSYNAIYKCDMKIHDRDVSHYADQSTSLFVLSYFYYITSILFLPLHYSYYIVSVIII
jgi:hypothetical protein